MQRSVAENLSLSCNAVRKTRPMLLVEKDNRNRTHQRGGVDGGICRPLSPDIGRAVARTFTHRSLKFVLRRFSKHLGHSSAELVTMHVSALASLSRALSSTSQVAAARPLTATNRRTQHLLHCRTCRQSFDPFTWSVTSVISDMYPSDSSPHRISCPQTHLRLLFCHTGSFRFALLELSPSTPRPSIRGPSHPQCRISTPIKV